MPKSAADKLLERERSKGFQRSRKSQTSLIRRPTEKPLIEITAAEATQKIYRYVETLLKKRKGEIDGPIKLVPKRKIIEIPGKPIPDPPKRKTGLDTTKPPPVYWPTQVRKALDDLYRPTETGLNELKNEHDDIRLYEPLNEGAMPWTLSDLSMEAMQGFINRTGKVVRNARQIPFVLQDRYQQVLPLDIDIRHAICVLDNGIYWKRRYMDAWPIGYPYPLREGLGFKTLFLQRWFGEYLATLEPGYIKYSEVVKNAKLVAPWIHRLEIKQLMAPQFKRKEPYNPKHPDDMSDIDLDTCMKIIPKPKRLNLIKVLPHLFKMEYIDICFGFLNYERHPGFHYARMNQFDIDLLSEALPQCPSLKSVRIYMSAFYSDHFSSMVPRLNEIKQLKKLEISNCKLDDEGAIAVAQFLMTNKTISMLCLKKNCITSEGVYLIAQALSRKKNFRAPLTILDLSYNEIGNLGGLYLSCMLIVNFTLICLKLVGCDLADVGGTTLAKAVELNPTLKKLDLTANKLTDFTAKHVIQAMEENVVIEEIDVRGNNISEVSLKDILDLSKEKKTTRRVVFTQQRRAALMNLKKGSQVRSVRKDLELKKPWQAYDVNCDSSTFSETDSGSITSLGSYESGEIKPDELSRFEKEISPKQKYKLITTDINKLAKHFSRFVNKIN